MQCQRFQGIGDGGASVNEEGSFRRSDEEEISRYKARGKRSQRVRNRAQEQE